MMQSHTFYRKVFLLKIPEILPLMCPSLPVQEYWKNVGRNTHPQAQKDLSNRLTALKKSSFKRLPGTSLPMFEVDDVSSKKKSTNFKHCPYVEVEYNIKTLHIRQQLCGYCRKVRGSLLTAFFK